MTERPAITEAKLARSIVTLSILMAILLGSVVVLGIYVATASLQPRTHVAGLVTGLVTVPTGESVYYKFDVPASYSAVTVTGTFTVTSGSPLNIYIMDSSNFAYFNAGQVSNKVFDSGTILSGTVNASIPSGATYYLLYSNRSSTTTYVQTTVQMHYRA